MLNSSHIPAFLLKTPSLGDSRRLQGAMLGTAGKLSPSCLAILGYMKANGNSISAREAFLHLNEMTSGSLARRIKDMRDKGYPITSEAKVNPVTNKQYTRYNLAAN